MRTKPYSGCVKSPNPPVVRPLSITLIAAFQGSLACYFLYFAAAACLSPAENLGSLRFALCLLIGRTDYRSYVGSTREVIAVNLLFLTLSALTIALYAAVTGWGLWRLKKWARHSVATICAVEVIYWLRGFLYFGVAGGFSETPQRALQPIYIVILLEAMIFLTLTFYGGVAESFGEIE